MENELFTELTLGEQANLSGGGNIYNSISIENNQSNINIIDQIATALAFGSSVAFASASNSSSSNQSNAVSYTLKN